MSSSSFINSLRRFISIRGKVTEFWSDRGTNFIGAVNELGLNKVNVKDDPIHVFLKNKDTTWKFNSPHRSHMGGSWERLIGIVRRILDNMLDSTSSKNLTHEVFVTFMAEVSAIVNSRPIVPVSTDKDCPFVFSPSILLTQKDCHEMIPYVAIDIKDMYRAQ